MKKAKIDKRGFGIGFIIKKSKKGKNGNGRIFTEVELIEISSMKNTHDYQDKGGK